MLDVFELIEKERGGVARIHRAFEAFPEGVAAHFQFYKSLILADDLPLARVEREFLALETSKANQCPYCILHHQTAFENYQSDVISDKKQKLYTEMAQVLSKEPWKMSVLSEKFLALPASEAQWQHAVMIISYFNFANRCAHAMGLDIKNDFEKTCS